MKTSTEDIVRKAKEEALFFERNLDVSDLMNRKLWLNELMDIAQKPLIEDNEKKQAEIKKWIDLAEDYGKRLSQSSEEIERLNKEISKLISMKIINVNDLNTSVIEKLSDNEDIFKEKISELEKENQELRNLNQGLYSENVNQKLHIEQLQNRLQILKSLRKSDSIDGVQPKSEDSMGVLSDRKDEKVNKK